MANPHLHTACGQSCAHGEGSHLPSPEGPAKAVLDQLAEDFLTLLQLEVLATCRLLCLKDLPTQRMLLKGGEPLQALAFSKQF